MYDKINPISPELLEKMSEKIEKLRIDNTEHHGKTEKALSTFLRPEFLNRVDEVITFRSLTEEDFARIAAIMLSQLAEVLAERGITLHFSAAVQKHIAEKSYSHKFGARNMRRYIQTNVEDKLAEEIISRYGENITQASLAVKRGELTLLCM